MNAFSALLLWELCQADLCSSKDGAEVCSRLLAPAKQPPISSGRGGEWGARCAAPTARTPCSMKMLA